MSAAPSSIRARWAHKRAVEGIRQQWNKVLDLAYGPLLGGHAADLLPPELIIEKGAPLPILGPPSARTGLGVGHGDTKGDPPPPPPQLQVNVGIIGAGAAGLFTALTLDYLNNAQSSVVFTYDILEADHSRSGGRLYTHRFSGSDTDRGHDYFDVGAMRFPDHAIMTRYVGCDAENLSSSLT